MLINRGADPSSSSHEDIVLAASHSTTVASVPSLLSHGWNPNTVDVSQKTALHHMVLLRPFNDHELIPIIDAFHTAGINLRAQDSFGKTAYDYAIQYNMTDVWMHLQSLMSGGN